MSASSKTKSIWYGDKERTASEMKNYMVRIDIGGNPDHGEPPILMESKCYWVDTLDECIAKAKSHVAGTGIGSGNWWGCEVFKDRKYIGRISYNGKFWDKDSEYGKR